jgi:hypothetical protein
MIYIRLSYKCEIEDACTEKEKSKYLFKTGWIYLVSNRIRFDQSKFGEEAISKEVELAWIPVATQIQQEIPFSVTR